MKQIIGFAEFPKSKGTRFGRLGTLFSQRKRRLNKSNRGGKRVKSLRK